jgi:hypothetical protein
VIGFAKFYRGTGQQTPELHLEQRQSRGETGIAGTAADAGPAGIADRFDRKRRD